MTRDDIIRMAREAGCIPVRHPEYDNDVQVFATPDVLERFAALIEDAHSKRTFDEGFVTVGHMRERIAAEREACAKVADDLQDKASPFTDYVADVGAAIRRRGEL